MFSAFRRVFSKTLFSSFKKLRRVFSSFRRVFSKTQKILAIFVVYLANPKNIL